MFWGVIYRRLPMLTLLRGSWGFALGTGALSVLLLPLLAQMRSGGGLHALLGWAVLMHLLARGWVERRLPDPSFANDLRTGNFEQIRLTPHTAHTLLIQRGLPDLLSRLLLMSLWMPLYALVAGALGLTLADACIFWLLFSFANYFVLGLVSVALLASAWEGTVWVLSAGLLGYAFMLDGGRARTAVASSGLFSAMLALPILGRVLLPDRMLIALPDLRGFALMWLIVEMLRFERIARWVNAPSGIWRWFYLIPCAAMMAIGGLSAWGLGNLRGLSGAEQTQFAMLGVFAAAGYLNLLLLTARRQAEPILQPLRIQLLEGGLLRVLSWLLVGAAILRWGLPTGATSFWVASLWLSGAEWLGGALTRRGIQRAHSRARNWVYGALLLGLLPALVFWVKPLHPALGALSPTYALLMASDAWRTAGVTTQPPLWLCLSAPLLRYTLILSVLALGILIGHYPARLFRLRRNRSEPQESVSQEIEWYALPWLYPLWDWIALRYATNPMTRLTLTERQPAWALGIGVLMLVLGLLFDFVGVGVSFLVMIGLGIFLWLWGYQVTVQRVRRWLNSGEIVSVFLAGVPATQIFWGWVYGAWSQQLRILIAAVSGYFWGWLIQALMTPPPAPGGIGIGLAFVTVGFGIGFYALYLALWSCAWLIAAPSAVRDQVALPQIAAPLLTPRAAVLATFYSLLACCAPLAPFLLIGLPVYASQSTIALHKLARAPGEPKR
ncbi:MAG: hypothetical protein N2651_01670 [Fimbriimonadales bacterium]|nr:hypothetical protein [Fimbriimonadales bacterium]